MNKIQRRAEARLAEALATLDALEHDRDRFAAEVTACELREGELRRARASVDELTQATGRLQSVRSLLTQTGGDLEAARAELSEAERDAERERALADAITITGQGEQLEAELRGKIAALERLVTPMLADLLETQDRVEATRGEYAEATKRVKGFSAGELVERSGKKPPMLLAPLSDIYVGTLPDHPLRESLKAETPTAWQVFHSELARQFGVRFREQQQAQFKEQARKNGARSSESYI